MTEALKVIYHDQRLDRFVFDEKSFAKILKEADKLGIRDLPVAIVSIVGDARKGKSFLMNFLLRYLERYGQKDWLGHPDEPLRGFSWRDGIERETTGIVIWPVPFVLTRKDGSKIVVLLMDTQGFFDDQTPHHVVEQFYSISTIVSSIQIYNQMHNIQSNDLMTLSQFSAYTRNMFQHDGQKAFHKLLFLMRDWTNQREFPHGFGGGKRFLRQKRLNQREIFGQKWSKLDECFSEVECFLMPTIGDRAEEPGFNGEISKLKPQFVEALKELIPNLLSPDNLAIRRGVNDELTFSRLFDRFKDLTTHLEGSIRRTRMMEEIDNAKNLAENLFDTIMHELKKRKDNSKKAFDGAKEQALELFDGQLICFGYIAGCASYRIRKRTELIQYIDRFIPRQFERPNVNWVNVLGIVTTVAVTAAKIYFLKRP